MESLVLVLVWIAPVLRGEPIVFDNYFDDTLREVDISEQTAIVGCLGMGEGLATKMTTAYEKCFGSEEYDISDLADNSDLPDRNGDGFPDKYNGNEACFYKEMGWVVGSKAQPKVIKQDMEGLDQELLKEFEGKVDECAEWDGEWDPARVKRDSEGPSGMGRLGYLIGAGKYLVRNTREEARPKPRSAINGGGGMAGKRGKGINGGNGGGVGGNEGKRRIAVNGGGGIKKGNGPMQARLSNGGNRKKPISGGGIEGRKGNGGMGAGTRNGENRKIGGNAGGKGGRKGNNGNGGGMGAGKGNGGSGGNRSGGNGDGRKTNEGGSQLLPESTYNQMWCFDLAMEQVLEKCIKQKLEEN